jgi:hypothetical protein
VIENARRMSKALRDYCGRIRVARSGFPGEKTPNGDVAPQISCAALYLTDGNHVRLSTRRGACSSMAPPSYTGNPGSIYANCEAALAREEHFAGCAQPDLDCFRAWIRMAEHSIPKITGPPQARLHLRRGVDAVFRRLNRG